jgi:hypothetical protein
MLSANSSNFVADQPSVKSTSVKRPTLSSSFYLNARHVQQACCQPFESAEATEPQQPTEMEIVKQRLMRLMGVVPQGGCDKQV